MKSILLNKTYAKKLLFALGMLSLLAANSYAAIIVNLACPTKQLQINGLALHAAYTDSQCKTQTAINNKTAQYLPFAGQSIANGGVFGLGNVALYNIVWNMLSVNNPGQMPSAIHGIALNIVEDISIPAAMSICSNCVKSPYYTAFRFGGLFLEYNAAGAKWPNDTCIPVTCNDSTKRCAFDVGGNNVYIYDHSKC